MFLFDAFSESAKFLDLGFNDEEALFRPLDLTFPPIRRLNLGNDADARGEFFPHQNIRQHPSFFYGAGSTVHHDRRRLSFSGHGSSFFFVRKRIPWTPGKPRNAGPAFYSNPWRDAPGAHGTHYTTRHFGAGRARSTTEPLHNR